MVQTVGFVGAGLRAGLPNLLTNSHVGPMTLFYNAAGGVRPVCGRQFVGTWLYIYPPGEVNNECIFIVFYNHPETGLLCVAFIPSMSMQ